MIWSCFEAVQSRTLDYGVASAEAEQVLRADTLPDHSVLTFVHLLDESCHGRVWKSSYPFTPQRPLETLSPACQAIWTHPSHARHPAWERSAASTRNPANSCRPCMRYHSLNQQLDPPGFFVFLVCTLQCSCHPSWPTTHLDGSFTTSNWAGRCIQLRQSP